MYISGRRAVRPSLRIKTPLAGKGPPINVRLSTFIDKRTLI
jgi:hypothetical protein